MASSPRFKIYNDSSEYVASVRYLEHAAAFIGAVGFDGWTVREGHTKAGTLWLEGSEAIPATESYDVAADIMRSRLA